MNIGGPPEKVVKPERAIAPSLDNVSGEVLHVQIKIKHPLSEGGFGALGLAARFSELNLNSGPYSGTGLYNMLAYTTLPLNVYYLFASGVPARQGAYINGAHSNLFEARAQVYW